MVREGKVLSTSNRNWEFAPTERLFDEFEAHRVVAVDMESATLAANAYRYRLSHATFLCVSDKPLHGAVKMPLSADHFYRAQVDRHLDIAIDALRWLHHDMRSSILLENSRSLRASEDPPWR